MLRVRCGITVISFFNKGDEMNELEQAMAALGRKQIALDSLMNEYANLLQAIAAVKSGTYTLDQFQILPGNSWRLDPISAPPVAE